MIFLLFICCTAAFSENRQTICASCTQTMKDNEDYVCRTGYGRGSTLEEADSIAKRDAYLALLQALRSSVKSICSEIKIENEGEEYFFTIKYLDRKEIPEHYYFTHDNVLVNTLLQCYNSVQDKNGTYYYVCCVLAAPKSDFKIVYDYMLNEKFLKMAFYFF